LTRMSRSGHGGAQLHWLRTKIESAQAPALAADIAVNGRHAYLSRSLVVLQTLEGLELNMSNESRRLAGVLLIVLPTVMYGGVSVLFLLIGDPKYMENPLRQDLWRAGHAHAGVWLILALVTLRYVDEAKLSNAMKWLVRGSIPIAALLVPAAFFLSVMSPDARAPNGLIYLAYVGAVVLAVGVLVLGIGLVRRPAQRS
jgi:hypothetical protein